MIRMLKASAAILALALASTTVAQSQVPLPNGSPASNIISFGDSLTDGGNFKAQNPGAPFGVPYMGPPLNLNRFTNGPTWAEILAAQTGAGAPRLFGSGALGAGQNVNYAFGSARSDAVPALIGGDVSGPANPFFPTIPGVPGQITAFQGNNGAATLGPNSLVTVWAGANNIFQAGSGYPSLAAAQIAPVTAAQAIGPSLSALMGLGARNIVVNNLPDLGSTPDARAGGPANMAGATAATNAFNATLAAVVQQAGSAAPAGTNLVYVDVNKVFAAAVANPAQFGFANVTAGCVLTPACAGNPAAWNTYAFWDGVHPTAAGHQLIAAAVADTLAAGLAAGAYAAFTGMGNNTRVYAHEASAARILNVMARQRLLGPAAVGDTEVSLVVDGATAGTSGNRGNQGAVRLLADHAVAPGARLGLALSYAFGSLSIPAAVSGNTNAFSLDLYGGYALPNGFFVHGDMGVSFNAYGDLRRPTLLPGITNSASARGTSLSANGALGWAFAVAPRVSLSPIVGLSVISSSLNRFEEATSVAAQLSFGGLTTTRVGASALLRLDAALSDTVTAHAFLGYTHVLSSTASSLGFGLVGNPSTFAPLSLRPNLGHAVNLGLGVTGAITERVSVGVDYRANLATRGGGSSHLGRATLSVRF